MQCMRAVLVRSLDCVSDRLVENFRLLSFLDRRAARVKQLGFTGELVRARRLTRCALALQRHKRRVVPGAAYVVRVVG